MFTFVRLTIHVHTYLQYTYVHSYACINCPHTDELVLYVPRKKENLHMTGDFHLLYTHTSDVLAVQHNYNEGTMDVTLEHTNIVIW